MECNRCEIIVNSPSTTEISAPLGISSPISQQNIFEEVIETHVSEQENLILQDQLDGNITKLKNIQQTPKPKGIFKFCIK
ncbi:hypothetical protein SS50377_22568 [Spironucleus salmonicida]|uniref:Uncharacterized protein n=1 Tax=Spironucleus salmonicida TaxID=348837 RepID=V6LBS5_9EUKA|nr:hypothetical protein SS50377_22568 [Spironucleus salmonicida]|eukprot:EST41940.1 Hypothetical protein SS50377_18244 [Spironucleus salmonicida]